MGVDIRIKRKICHRLFGGALCALLFISTAFAQVFPEQVQREHEQRLKEQQNRDDDRMRHDQSAHDVFLQPSQAKTSSVKSATPDVPCVNVKSISVSGVTVFDYQLINNITSLYSSRCLHLEDVNHLAADLSNLYLIKGYITSRASVQPQKIDKGSLEVLVIEGEIESLQSIPHFMTAHQYELTAAMQMNF